MGERCKLPQRGLGRSFSRNRMWCILALKSDNWWQQFLQFFWESTDQISCILNIEIVYIAQVIIFKLTKIRGQQQGVVDEMKTLNIFPNLSPWSLDASADLPAGPTADAFNLYVAVAADIPTAAESTDASASQLMMSQTTNSINYQIQWQQTPSAINQVRL